MTFPAPRGWWTCMSRRCAASWATTLTLRASSRRCAGWATASWKPGKGVRAAEALHPAVPVPPAGDLHRAGRGAADQRGAGLRLIRHHVEQMITLIGPDGASLRPDLERGVRRTLNAALLASLPLALVVAALTALLLGAAGGAVGGTAARRQPRHRHRRLRAKACRKRAGMN